jgi:N-acetylmuramoyl-L-alanine amidase
MFIFSFNVGKLKKKKFMILTIALVLIVGFSGAVSAFLRISRDEGLAESADTVPYEKIIVLDAGHGGEDCGAVGVNGVYEKDLNMAVANTVAEMLEKEGYLVVLTRSEDKLLYGEDEDVKGIRKISDLKNRCKIAESYPDSIFVSIHMNSFGDAKYSGLQVYYSTKNEGSGLLATSIQNKARELLQPQNNRTTKPGKGIYVLENIPNDAVLVECGFLTNEEECKKLSEKEYQKQLSFSIVCGIIEYVKNE